MSRHYIRLDDGLSTERREYDSRAVWQVTILRRFSPGIWILRITDYSPTIWQNPVQAMQNMIRFYPFEPAHRQDDVAHHHPCGYASNA